ncbi:hypothetical protein C8R45DRAFT_937195 [Mycena sanguinolenta]|nr:hypothetical protein C8R45DRAFT_937195 [Mycena sanguinolenta]
MLQIEDDNRRQRGEYEGGQRGTKDVALRPKRHIESEGQEHEKREEGNTCRPRMGGAGGPLSVIGRDSARVVMPALTLREGSYDERFFSSADDDGEGFSTAGTDTETGTAFLPPRRKRQCEREAEGREEALPVREHAAQLGLGPGEGEGGRGGVGSAEEAKERFKATIHELFYSYLSGFARALGSIITHCGIWLSPWGPAPVCLFSVLSLARRDAKMNQTHEYWLEYLQNNSWL